MPLPGFPGVLKDLNSVPSGMKVQAAHRSERRPRSQDRQRDMARGRPAVS